MKFYKYHKNENQKDGILDPSFFDVARIVLIKANGKSKKLYFVESQSKKDNTQVIGYMDLPKGFSIPSSAVEITEEQFRRMTD